MFWRHAFPAFLPCAVYRNGDCYDPLPTVGESKRIAMNPLSFTSILPRCWMVESWRAQASAPLPRSRDYEAQLPRASIGDEIVDFLEGRTHGEGLLHALYDHILNEPVPERMRKLVQKGTTTTPR